VATFQIATSVRDALMDAIETSVGTAPTLKIRTGAAPANPAAADSGTVLASPVLPSDWMAASSGGVKAMSGTWQDASADATGTAGHFRIYDSGGTCRIQGDVTATGGGGAMTLDNTSLAAGQNFSVTQFTLTAPNP
jgi:hypothetical protein